MSFELYKSVIMVVRKSDLMTRQGVTARQRAKELSRENVMCFWCNDRDLKNLVAARILNFDDPFGELYDLEASKQEPNFPVCNSCYANLRRFDSWKNALENAIMERERAESRGTISEPASGSSGRI
jgi:hypothetical protein